MPELTGIMKQFTGICRDKRSTPSGPSGRERAPEEGDDILRTFKVWKGKAAKAGYELTMKRASDASSPVRAIGDSLDERFGDRGGATSCHGSTRTGEDVMSIGYAYTGNWIRYCEADVHSCGMHARIV